MTKKKNFLKMSVALLAIVFILTGCSKVDLSNVNGGTGNAPEAGGTPPDGMTPPDGGTPPDGQGAPAGN